LVCDTLHEKLLSGVLVEELGSLDNNGISCLALLANSGAGNSVYQTERSNCRGRDGELHCDIIFISFLIMVREDQIGCIRVFGYFLREWTLTG